MSKDKKVSRFEQLEYQLAFARGAQRELLEGHAMLNRLGVRAFQSKKLRPLTLKARIKLLAEEKRGK